MLIGLTGKKQSGKNTSSSLIKEIFPDHSFVELSFAAPVKEALVVFNPPVKSSGIRYNDLSEEERRSKVNVLHLGGRALVAMTEVLHLSVQQASDLMVPFLQAVNPYVEGDFLSEMDQPLEDLKKSIPEIRRLLQHIGTEFGRSLLGENFWVDLLSSKMKHLPKDTSVLITDVRFPNEQKLIENNKGTLLLIKRYTEEESKDSHVSEAPIDALEVDSVINNSGSLDDLRSRLEAVLV